MYDSTVCNVRKCNGVSCANAGPSLSCQMPCPLWRCQMPCPLWHGQMPCQLWRWRGQTRCTLPGPRRRGECTSGAAYIWGSCMRTPAGREAQLLRSEPDAVDRQGAAHSLLNSTPHLTLPSLYVGGGYATADSWGLSTCAQQKDMCILSVLAGGNQTHASWRGIDGGA